MLLCNVAETNRLHFCNDFDWRRTWWFCDVFPPATTNRTWRCRSCIIVDQKMTTQIRNLLTLIFFFKKKTHIHDMDKKTIFNFEIHRYKNVFSKKTLQITTFFHFFLNQISHFVETWILFLV